MIVSRLILLFSIIFSTLALPLETSSLEQIFSGTVRLANDLDIPGKVVIKRTKRSDESIVEFLPADDFEGEVTIPLEIVNADGTLTQTETTFIVKRAVTSTAKTTSKTTSTSRRSTSSSKTSSKSSTKTTSTKKTSTTSKKTSTSTKKSSTTTKKSSTTTKKSSTTTKKSSTTTKKSSTTTKKSSTTTRRSSSTTKTTTKTTTKAASTSIVPPRACPSTLAAAYPPTTGPVTCPSTAVCNKDALCPIQQNWLDILNTARANATLIGKYKGTANAPQPLKWSCYLEATAARYAQLLASKCFFAHSAPSTQIIFNNASLGGWQSSVGEILNIMEVRGNTDPGPLPFTIQYGQNFAGYDWIGREKKYYTSETACAAGDSNCGHLAQVLWKNSQYVGCAAVETYCPVWRDPGGSPILNNPDWAPSRARFSVCHFRSGPCNFDKAGYDWPGLNPAVSSNCPEGKATTVPC